MGLALYIWAWVSLFSRTWAAIRTGLGSARFGILYGTVLLLIGLDEGTIPIPNAWTALLPVVLLALSRHLVLSRGARAPARGEGVVQEADHAWADSPVVVRRLRRASF